MLERIVYILNEQGQFFFFFLSLHLIMNMFIWRARDGKFKKRFFEKLINSFFFLIAFHFLFLGITIYFPIFSSILFGFTSFMCIVEMTIYFEYQILFSKNTFIVLGETNSQESKEFLKDLLSWKFFKNIGFSLCILMILPLVFSRILYFLWKNYDLQYEFFFLLGISFAIFLQAHKKKKRERYYSYLPIFRIGKEYFAARRELKESANALEIQKKIEEKLLIKNVEGCVDTLIFVLGESASRNYMEIYDGFSSYFKNSPYMIERKRGGELFVFEDVISPESLTALSIPKILTFKNYEQEGEWYHFPNLISILKKAGYHTYWFSNQHKKETIGEVFSFLADQSFFSEDLLTMNEISKEKEVYDDTLIKEGKKILGEEKKKAIFFHLSGSHTNYAKRYPEEFNLDQVKNVRRELSDKKKQYIAEYSNSLRYTDYILEQILHQFTQERTLLFYLSDHAEELWEKRNVRGHTGEKGSKYMVEIPMFIYLNKQLQESCPTLLEQCKKSVSKPYMIDDIIHTVIGSLGISVAGYEEKRNILSDFFDAGRKRIYQGQDYDIFWKNQFE